MRIIDEVKVFAGRLACFAGVAENVSERALRKQNEAHRAPTCNDLFVRNTFFHPSVRGNPFVVHHDTGPSRWADPKLWYLFSMRENGLPFPLCREKLPSGFEDMVEARDAAPEFLKWKKTQLKDEEYRIKFLSYEWDEFRTIGFYFIQMLGRNAFRSLSIHRRRNSL